MDSIRLPWEVIEHVIEYSRGRPNTLCSLSLTCRQLLPRSRCAMISCVQLKCSDRVLSFIEYLQANPTLRPFVHTIVVSLASFAPSLLYMLTNLSSIECVPSEISPRPGPIITLHPISLARFRRLGTRIHTLRLTHVSFSTFLAFTQVLLAFTSIKHLICERVEITATDDEPLLNVSGRRLSEQMRLRVLTVSLPLPSFLLA